VYNRSMSPFWQNLEHLPSASREKAREKNKRTPKEYEKSRNKVKENVKEADDRMKNKEHSAEVMLYIEMNEEDLKEKMKEESFDEVTKEFGSYDARQWAQMQKTFAEGQFDLQVETTDEGKPKISMNIDMPEGNVAEKIQLNQSLQDALITKATLQS